LLFVLGFFVRGEGTHWLDEVVRRVYMFLCSADAAETAEDNALVATCRTYDGLISTATRHACSLLVDQARQ
jgi:hypothetical protein